MKQNIKNLIALSCMLTGSLMLGSCNDFLDKEPLDKVTATSYFNSDADLASFTIKQYDLFPIGKDQWNMGPAALGDNNTDNQANAASETKYWEPGSVACQRK